MIALELKNFHLKYKKSGFEIGPNFNLSIDKGDFLGLVGESGCGKSSIGKVLISLINHEEKDNFGVDDLQGELYFPHMNNDINYLNATFIANSSDSCVLYTYPKPPLNAFIAGNDTICSNTMVPAQVSVSFSVGIEPYTFVYAINGIDQSSITTTVNPYVINTFLEGNYTLSSFSDAQEIGGISGSAIVTVNPSPTASFSTVTDTLNILSPSIQLNDISLGNIVKWEWDFGDNTINSAVQNPYHIYKDSTGIYQISLIITDDFGCTDTTVKTIWITDQYWMYIPNAFSPDSDGINDMFCLEYNGIRLETFSFNIYDRYSNLVFTTDKIEDLECFLNVNGWDGTHYKTGNDLPMGTYVYEVYYQDFEGWKHQEQGHIFIVR